MLEERLRETEAERQEQVTLLQERLKEKEIRRRGRSRWLR